MFAKVFSQIFESTIAEDYKVRHVFMDLLVMADSDGVIDKTPEAISRLANIPLDVLRCAIEALCAPDPRSRTPDHEGRRLILIDDHRSWGWKIVNYNKYRDIRDEEARRIANRTYKRAQRERERQHHVLDSQQMSSMSAKGEGDVEAEEKPRNHTGGKNTNHSGNHKKSPPYKNRNGKYKQSDFDERDLRKLSQAEAELSAKLNASVGAGGFITEQEFFTSACEIAGITVERGLKLKQIQRQWPQ